MTFSQPDDRPILGFFISVSTKTKMTEAARSLAPSSAPRLETKSHQTKKTAVERSQKADPAHRLQQPG